MQVSFCAICLFDETQKETTTLFKNLHSGPTQVNQITIFSAQLAFENDQKY